MVHRQRSRAFVIKTRIGLNLTEETFRLRSREKLNAIKAKARIGPGRNAESPLFLREHFLPLLPQTKLNKKN